MQKKNKIILLGQWRDKKGSIVSLMTIDPFGYFIYKHLEKVPHHVIIITNDAKKDLFVHSCLFLTSRIALHNFPTGNALGDFRNSFTHIYKTIFHFRVYIHI